MTCSTNERAAMETQHKQCCKIIVKLPKDEETHDGVDGAAEGQRINAVVIPAEPGTQHHRARQSCSSNNYSHLSLPFFATRPYSNCLYDPHYAHALFPLLMYQVRNGPFFIKLQQRLFMYMYLRIGIQLKIYIIQMDVYTLTMLL